MARRGKLRVATWNVNSVRLRQGLVRQLLAEAKPDVLCLQETKSPDEHFPLGAMQEAGYRHIAIKGMKGYNGVAILSRLPFTLLPDTPDWCAKGD